MCSNQNHEIMTTFLYPKEYRNRSVWELPLLPHFCFYFSSVKRKRTTLNSGIKKIDRSRPTDLNLQSKNLHQYFSWCNVRKSQIKTILLYLR